MVSLRKILRSSFAGVLLISSIAFLVVVGLRAAGKLQWLELAAYDWFVRLQPVTIQPDPPIVVIGISEDDIKNMGQWPLTDAKLAELMSMLIDGEPRVIGLDVFRDMPVPPGTEALYSVLASDSPIIGVMKYGPNGIPPPSALRYPEQVGFNDILVDPGGIVRRGLLFLDDGKEVVYSFALRIAMVYLRGEKIVPLPDTVNPEHLRLGKTTIRPLGRNHGGYIRSDMRGYQFLLDFKDPTTVFPVYSVTSLLSGKIDARELRDKVILVGVIAESVKDAFYTPRSRGLQGRQQMAGILLHAHSVSQLLRSALGRSSPIAVMNERQGAFWILLWAVIGGVVGCHMGSVLRFFLLSFGCFLVLGISAYLAFASGWWIPLAPPALTWLTACGLGTAYVFGREKQERATLMQLFSRHVSPEVAEVIWEQREEFLEGGRPRTQELMATVLFSDLKGFTSVSEAKDPASLMAWLNTHMEAMTGVVMDHGGVIDDYAGDGLKANFGVPVPRTTEEEIGQDAVNAVNCGLAMAREMDRLEAMVGEEGVSFSGMRIGICTGLVVAGTVGSAKRLKYTTVGDTVNIASRLESHDKDIASKSPCRILISESTLDYLDNRFKVERIGEENLKGRDEKTTIYLVIGKQGITSEDDHGEVTT